MTSKAGGVMILVMAVAVINLSEAAVFLKPNNNMQIIEVIQDLCPTIGIAEYEVIVLGSDSPQTGGCAFVDYEYSDLRKSLNLWLGDLHQGKQRCREQGMEKLRFSCLSEASLLSSGNSVKGISYVQLYGLHTNKENQLDTRCAMYEKDNRNATLFRMLVSADDSCDGLLEKLSQQHPTIPNGAILMQMNRVTKNLKTKRSTSDSKDPIKIQFSEPRYFWQMG